MVIQTHFRRLDPVRRKILRHPTAEDLDDDDDDGRKMEVASAVVVEEVEAVEALRNRPSALPFP